MAVFMPGASPPGVTTPIAFSIPIVYNIFMARLIKIFDTTLRDGEQCPGASLNPEEKLEIARQLARLNVDAIEAGFAIASPGDFESVKTIAQQVKGPIICSLARAVKKDIQAAFDAIKYSDRPRIHTFLAKIGRASCRERG